MKPRTWETLKSVLTLGGIILLAAIMVTAFIYGEKSRYDRNATIDAMALPCYIEDECKELPMDDSPGWQVGSSYVQCIKKCRTLSQAEYNRKKQLLKE